VLALLPPVLVILAMQRWFVQALVETEKECGSGAYGVPGDFSWLQRL
jgi:hypothetical protein